MHRYGSSTVREETRMSHFAAQRRQLVDTQLRTNDVTDLDVLAAFDAVPRERFVPETGLAYSDHDVVLATAPRRWLPRAAGVAKMMQAADIRPTDKVLVVGAGTGYTAAVAARLAAKVVALESDPNLADAARQALAAEGVGNVAVVTGSPAAGAPGEAPFDVILVDGAVGRLPVALTEQLKDGGRLAVVEGEGLSGRARLYVRHGADVAGRLLFNWAMPLLPGTEVPQEFVF
jgi:protein-L-isoaspartate(D-aspartate) O-methyltransferase